MEQEFALDWLEGKVYELDPENELVKNLSRLQVQSIIRKADNEKKRLMSFLKHLPYQQNKRCRINEIINAYFDGLNHLIKIVKLNLKRFPSGLTDSKVALEAVLRCLEQAHCYLLERHFTNLNPETILAEISAITLESVNPHKIADSDFMISNPKLRDLLIEDFRLVFGYKQGNNTTLRKIEYWRDITSSFQCNWNVPNTTGFFDNPEILLIENNYNTPEFVKYLEIKVHNSIESLDSRSEKETHLTYLHKVFNQIPIKKGIIYSIDYDDLIVTINSWFIQEITYSSKEGLAKDNSEVGLQTNNEPEKKASKVVCNLTVDQLALLFKAADQAKIITANSLSAIFKLVVPFLSTQNTPEISAASMRSKSYIAEERDKETLLLVLAKLIKEVEEF